MKTRIKLLLGALLVLGGVSQASSATRVGMLRCYVQGGTGYIVGSSHEARCIFTSEYGRRERYWARMKRIGLDVGYTGNSMIVWAVYAPSDIRHRALKGSYIGASADAAIGVGGGGNFLIGGNGRTISLQPLSVKAETGLAIAAGAGDLELR